MWKKSDDRYGNQEHLQKTVRQVPKNMVAKKDRKDLYPKNYTGDNNWMSNPQKYKGGNKYMLSAITPKKDMSAWCAERKAKGYGVNFLKIALSTPLRM